MNDHITVTDLEQIRIAAIEFYTKTNHEFKDLFVGELTKEPAWIDPENVPRIGIWEMENRKGRLALVRHPPFSHYMVYYGLFVKRVSRGWLVEDGWHEIAKLRGGP